MDEEPSAFQSPDYPLLLSHIEGGNSSTLGSGSTPFPERYSRIAQGLRSSLPPTHGWLNPADIKITGKHPVAAGGFADIWEGVLDGRRS